MTTPKRKITGLTEKGLPNSLKPFFWDSDFSKLGADEYSYFIIGRLLECGDESAVNFLLDTYAPDEIIYVLKNSRALSKRSRNFWKIFFDVKDEPCMPKRYPTPFGNVYEQIPLKFPLQSIFGRNKGLKMADPRDIGRMKLISIGSRGSKKDFVDLYCITRKIVSLDHLLKMAVEENQGLRYSKPLFLKGLVDFEEADREGPLKMIWDISWTEIKATLIKEVKAAAQTLRKKRPR